MVHIQDWKIHVMIKNGHLVRHRIEWVSDHEYYCKTCDKIYDAKLMLV